MKAAGPAARIEVLLPTNRPPPTMPPIEIIIKWRPRKARLSWVAGALAEVLASIIRGIRRGQRLMPLLYQRLAAVRALISANYCWREQSFAHTRTLARVGRTFDRRKARCS